MADFISKKVDILERCRKQATDYAPTQWKQDHICWQAADEIERLRAALRLYGRHRIDTRGNLSCQMYGDSTKPCSCGYAALVAPSPGETGTKP